MFSLLILALGAPGSGARAEEAGGNSRGAPPRESGSAGLDEGQASAVRLVWFDVQEAAPFEWTAAARETQSIFAGMGVRMSWRKASRAQTMTSAGEVQVIVLSAPPAGIRQRSGELVMGTTQRSSARAVWVILSNVAETLGIRAPLQGTSSLERFELALAVGRIIAHEVFHFLVPDEPHAKAGLMAPRLGRTQLLRRPHIDPRSRGALLARLDENGKAAILSEGHKSASQ